MSPVTSPLEVYQQSGSWVWRVEARDHYTVPGDEPRQAAFHADGVLPPPRPEKAGDLALIQQLHEHGVQVGRVHVIRLPLTPYLRYELAVYAENVAAGEEVRIADAGQHPELASIVDDFVMNARQDLVLFDHAPDGLVTGYRAETSPAAVQRYHAQLYLAVSSSVPLAEFMAAAAL